MFVEQNEKNKNIMTQAKNIRVRIETFDKLEWIKSKARETGKMISLGVIIDDLCDLSNQLPYIKKITQEQP